MNVGNPRAQISEQILAEACDWFIDCNEGELDVSGRERLNQWLRRSPEHVHAYLEIAAAWDDSGKLAGARTLDSATLVADALEATNVVHLDPPAMRPQTHARPHRPKLPWIALAAAVCALVAMGVGLLNQRNTYATVSGEQRSIALDDGSTVELNVRSRLRVRFSRAERVVELTEGQALFRVTQDASRPFIVSSDAVRVRAVGTEFDVYRRGAGTTITVIAGRVAVTDSRIGPILLSAGERLTVAPGTAPSVVTANTTAATAWTQRKLMFEETPLSAAVAEFNRYNSSQMIIEDAALAEYHIRGNFDAGNPERLIQFLRDRFGVDVRRSGNEIHLSRKSSATNQ